MMSSLLLDKTAKAGNVIPLGGQVGVMTTSWTLAMGRDDFARIPLDVVRIAEACGGMLCPTLLIVWAESSRAVQGNRSQSRRGGFRMVLEMSTRIAAFAQSPKAFNTRQ